MTLIIQIFDIKLFGQSNIIEEVNSNMGTKEINPGDEKITITKFIDETAQCRSGQALQGCIFFCSFVFQCFFLYKSILCAI